MGNIVLMMSVSADGFIEGPDRDIGWHLVDDEIQRDVNLAAETDGDLALSGADLAAAFRRHDLIDGYRVYVHPVAIGPWQAPLRARRHPHRPAPGPEPCLRQRGRPAPPPPRLTKEEPAMAAYVIVETDITDPEGYERYKATAPGAVAAAGGRYLARGGELDVLEGDWRPPRLVILEFEDVAAARRWYDSERYREARRLREGTARLRMVAVQGV